MASPTLSSTGQVDVTESDLRYGMFVNLDARAREIEAILKTTWVEIADIAQTMEDCGYWREGGYTSFSSWLRSAMPCSYSWARLAMSVRKDLKELAVEELEKMPLANAEVIRKMEPVQRKEILAAAQAMTPEQFLSAVVSHRPDLALELKVKLRYTATASQKVIIGQFLDGWRLMYPEDRTASDITIIVDGLMEGWMQDHRDKLEQKAAIQ